MTKSIKPVVLDFTGAKERAYGPTDWLQLILTANNVCATGGAAPIFGEPEIEPNGPTGVYREIYPDAIVELDGDGTSTARIYSTTDHGSSVLRIAAQSRGHQVVELDDESSASRQHFIDTGVYLRPGEAL